MVRRNLKLPGGFIDLSKLPSYEREVDIRAVAYKTVDTFSGITGRRLVLKDENGVPHTDGLCIYVPFGTNEFYNNVEHEISHILFKSDGGAKEAFITQYCNLITKAAKSESVEIKEKDLQEILSILVGILEDHRVSSLWGQIYPGSYDQFRKNTRKAIESFGMGLHVSFLVLFFYVEAEMEVDPGPLSPYIPIFEEALRLVHKRGPLSTFVAAKWLVTRMIDQIIKEQKETGDSPNQKKAKAAQSLAQSDKGNSELTERVDDFLPLDDSARLNEAQNAMVSTALKMNVKSEEAYTPALQESEQEMQKLMEEVQSKLWVPPSKDDWLRQDAPGTVVFRDISPNLVTRTREKAYRMDAAAAAAGKPAMYVPVLCPPLSRSDRNALEKLRNFFFQIRSRKAQTREDAGSEVDVASFIERITGDTALPVFRQEVRGRGFKALVLIDRSGSMEGIKTLQAERACRLISKALDFPFVTLKLWGFQSTAKGQADITRFDPKQDLFTTAESTLGGGTPLHIAVRLALRELKAGNEAKHLFIVSDGIPTFSRRDNSVVSSYSIMAQIRKDVSEARKQGVGVTGVMIDLLGENKWVEFMFGPPAYWKVIQEQKLGKDLFDVVVSSFEKYLRNG